MYDKKMMALVGRLVKAGLPVLVPGPSRHEIINDGIKCFYKRALIELRNGDIDFVCWAFSRALRGVPINTTKFRETFNGLPVFTYIARNDDLHKIITSSGFKPSERGCANNRAFRVAWVKTMLNMFNKKVRESSRAKTKEKCHE